MNLFRMSYLTSILVYFIVFGLGIGGFAIGSVGGEEKNDTSWLW